MLNEREAPVKSSSVLTKAEASSAPSPRKANVGLNFFTAGRAAAKKAEKSTMPGGVHQVRRGIISRNATPVLSKTADKVLDPETKERLMEKVKAIRAEKQQEHIRRLSMSEGIHTTRTSSLTMSSQVSNAPHSSMPSFKTGAAPGFCTAPSYPTGMMMGTGMTMSTSTLSSGSIHPSTSMSPSAGAIPKGTSFHSPSSLSSSKSASPYTPSAMSSMSSSLLLSSSSTSTRTSVLPPPSCTSTPIPPKALPLASDAGLGLAAIGSLDPPAGGKGIGLKVATATPPSGLQVAIDPPTATASGQGIGLASVGNLSSTATASGQKVGLAAVGALSPTATASGQGVGLAAVGALSPTATASGHGVGLAAVGSLSPLGATGGSSGISRATAGAFNPQSATGGVGLAASGTLSPHGATSPLSVLSGGSLNNLKNRLPSGRKL